MTIDRRTVLKGAASLPLAAVLADPLIARAVAAGLDEVTTEAAGKTVRAALAVPETTPAPAVVLVHEWWGLNDQIKSVAAELAKEGFIGLALDLYDGEVARTPDEARTLMGQAMADPQVAQDTAAAWIDWLGANEQANGKTATVGWCFGGGWALNAALLRPVEGAVVYYGNVAPEWGGVDRSPAALGKLQGPVLGHFATRDGWIDADMVSGFEARMKEAGQPLAAHWYEADHGFANPSAGSYDKEEAQLAWQRTLAFFGEMLG